MKKTIVTILIVVLIIFSVYFASKWQEPSGDADMKVESTTAIQLKDDGQESNTTNNWVVYENNEYGFLFKHPKFCKIRLPDKNSDPNTYAISCPTQENDIYNFILFTPQNNDLTFDEYLSKERSACLQWLNEFSKDDKNANDNIVMTTTNDMKTISNISSCGHNVGAPTELWLFNKDEKIVVNFTGDIYIDELNISKDIIDSFRFIEK